MATRKTSSSKKKSSTKTPAAKKSNAKKSAASAKKPAAKSAKKSSAQKPARKTSKRTLIEPHAGDKRYVRRDKKGEFKKEVSVGRSLAADRRTKSKTKAKKGQGDRGDTTSKSSSCIAGFVKNILDKF